MIISFEKKKKKEILSGIKSFLIMYICDQLS